MNSCACGCGRKFFGPGLEGFAREACSIANTHAREQALRALREFAESQAVLLRARQVAHAANAR